MRKLFLLPLLFVAAITSAQEFPGFRSGNYSGVNGVFFNPASIADSRYRFDVNIFSIHAMVGNNRAGFKLGKIGELFKGDSLTNQFLGNGTGLSSGQVHMDVHGPSFMFNVGSKMSFALTTRARVLGNIVDLDGALVNQLREDAEDQDVSFPYTISSNSNMQLITNAWAEIGLSGARVLMDKGTHFLKGGLTLKLLSGAGNAYTNIDKLNATLDEDLLGDVYMENATGRVSTGFGGLDFSNVEAGDFTKFDNLGFGGDIGFVYEFRPDHAAYKAGGDSYQNDLNKYKFRVGLSLLDIGSIRYKRDMARSGAFNVDITGGERFYLSELADQDIEDYKDVFENNPQYFQDVSPTETTYSVALPTTLQLDLDYHVKGGIYTSLAAQLPLNAKNDYNSRYYSSFTLTPRYEGRLFGAYLPLNVNSLTKFNAGLSLRFGPLFLGSGSLFSALIGESKQADVHFGIRIGGLKKSSPPAASGNDMN